jgi:hypothetical protein
VKWSNTEKLSSIRSELILGERGKALGEKVKQRENGFQGIRIGIERAV